MVKVLNTGRATPFPIRYKIGIKNVYFLGLALLNNAINTHRNEVLRTVIVSLFPLSAILNHRSQKAATEPAKEKFPWFSSVFGPFKSFNTKVSETTIDLL